MICFEVEVNDQHLTTAGIDKEGVFTAFVGYRNVRGQQGMSVTVLGHVLEMSVALEWPKQRLSGGDVVTVRIVERAHAADPVRRRELMPRQGLTIDRSIAAAREQLATWQKALGKLEAQKAAGATEYTRDDEDGWYGDGE